MASPARPRIDLALATFGILALELALIRWMSGQIRIVAYFQNFVLIAAFLGMGLGVALGKRRPRLAYACLPLLAVLSVLLAFSDDLGLMYFRFPDPTIALWGGEVGGTGALAFAKATVAVVALFWAVTAIFICAGAPVGALFAELPPLVAYSADLLGSLAGVIVMTTLAALGTSPPFWIAAGSLPFVWLARGSPRALVGTGLAAVAAIALAAVSIDSAEFSPYNALDIKR